MTKDELFKTMLDRVLGVVETWEDMYKFIDQMAGRVNSTGSPILAFDAMYTMYAFLNALREMPEEGDIRKLAERMVRIMVYESKEKLGTEVVIITREEAIAQIEGAVKEAVTEGLVTVAMAEKEVSGKLLH